MAAAVTGSAEKSGIDLDLERALALHRAGRLENALAIYQDILKAEPRHFHALHLSGAIALQTGHPERAARLIAEALEVDPAVAAAHFNRGLALQALGRPADALASYDRSLALHLDHAEAHNNRGNALHDLGRPGQALASYDRALALNPGYANAHSNRGNALRALGRPGEALASYDRALALNPSYAKAHNNRGNALRDLGRPGEALANYDRALALKPGYVNAHINRGNALRDLGRPVDALADYDRALALQPNHAPARNNRGNALWDLGRPADALTDYDRALVLQPNHAQAHNNRCNALWDLGRLDAALTSVDRALALAPGFAEAWANRGRTLRALGRLDEALASYDRALDLRPDLTTARHNRALLLLQKGDFALGWREHEWRWQGDPNVRARDLPAPQWRGETDLAGQTILLHGEQGLGDQIQFCRYVPMVKALGATVVLEVAAPLVPVCRTLDGVDCVIALGDPLPPFQCHCPLLSLPLAFGTTLNSVPTGVPYLSAEVGKMRAWADRIGPARRMRVGLVWNGGYRPDQPRLWAVNERRNIPFAVLARLNMPEVDFFSLQKGEPAETQLREALSACWAEDNFHDHAAGLGDFAVTAALVANLDLVVGVDTSTVHLAGALGKPVWILNRFDSCWRWLADRADSPWYPTARLYWQTRIGDWDSVVERVRRDLLALARGWTPARRTDAAEKFGHGA